MDFAWRLREVYPGLGLNLRHVPDEHGAHYPTDLQCDAQVAFSQLLPVREVAMMFIMDMLTDKANWHKKVFDVEIVSTWRKEALGYPEEELWSQATGGKYANQEPTFGLRSPAPALKGIITSDIFEYVRVFRSFAHYHGLIKL